MFKLFGKKSSKKASLGEESSFYYNEKLGRWVERGKEDEAAKEAELPPPPKSFSRQSLLSDPGPASHGSAAGKSVNEDSDSAPPTGPANFYTKRALGDRYVPVISSSNSTRSQTPTQMLFPVATASKSKPATFLTPSPVVSFNNLADQADSVNETIPKCASEQTQVDHSTEAGSETALQALLDEPEQPPAQHAESVVANADESPAFNELLNSPAAYSNRDQSTMRAPEDTSTQPEADAVSKLDEDVSADIEGPTAETITQEADVAAYSYENWYASQQSDANVTATNEGNAADYQFDWSQWGAYDTWTQEQKDYYAAYCQYWSSAQPQAMEESTVPEAEASEPAQVHAAVANQVMETELVDTINAVAAATEDVEILQSTFEDEEVVESGTHVFTEIPLTGESQAFTSENGVCVDDDSASSHDGSGVSDQSGYAVKNGSSLFPPLNWIKQKSNSSQGKLVGMPWDTVAAVDYDQYWKGTDEDFYQQPEIERDSQHEDNTNHRFLAADLVTVAQPEASHKPGIFGLLSPPLFASLEPSGNSLPNKLMPISSTHDSTSLAQLPVATGAWHQSEVGKVMPAVVNQPVSELLIHKDALVATDGAGMADATSTASHPLPDEAFGDVAVLDSSQPAADAASKPMEAKSTTTQPTCDPLVATEAAPIVQNVADSMVDRMATTNEGVVVSTGTTPDDGVAMALGLATEEPAERPTWPGPNGWDYVEGADYSKYYYTPDFSSWGDYSTWDTEKMQIYWEWYYGCQYYQHQATLHAASEQGLSLETSSEMVVQDTAAAVETIQAAGGQDTAAAVERIQAAPVDQEGPQNSVHVSRTVSEQDDTPADGQNIAAPPQRENGATMEDENSVYEHKNTAAFEQQAEAPDYTSALTSYELAYAGYGPPQASGDASTSRAGPPSHGGRMPLPERHTFDDMAAEEMEDIYLPDATNPEPTHKSDHTVGWGTDLNDSWDNEVNTDGWDLHPAAAASGHAATSTDDDTPASNLSPLRRHSSCSVQVTNTPQPPHTPPRDDHATSPVYIDEDIVPPSPTRIVEDAPAPTSSIPTPSTSSTSGVPLSSATQMGPSPFPVTETTKASQPSTSSASHAAVTHSTASTSTPTASALPPLAPSHHATVSLHPSIEAQAQVPTTNAANTAPAIAEDDAEDFFSHLGGEEDPEPAFCSAQTESSQSSTAAIRAHPLTAYAQEQSDPSSSFFEPATKAHTVGTTQPHAVSSTTAPPVISPASGLAAATEEELDFFEHLGEEQEAEAHASTGLTDPFSATAVFAPTEELATAFGYSLVEQAQIRNNTEMEDDRPEPSSQPTPLAQPSHQNLLDAAFDDPAAFFCGLLATDSERDTVDASILAGPHIADNSAVSGTLSPVLVPSAVSSDVTHSNHQNLTALTPPANIGTSLPHEQAVDTGHACEPIHFISSASGVNSHPGVSVLSECASPSSIMIAAAHPPHIDVPASSHDSHATSGASTPAGDPSSAGHASSEQTTPAGTSTAGPSSPNGHYATSTGDAYASSASDAITSRTAATTTVAADDGASSSSDPGTTSTVTPQPYLFDWSQNPRPNWSLWGPRDTWGPDAQAMYSDWARWRKEQRQRRQTVGKKGPRSHAHSSTHTSSATTPEHSAAGADTVDTISTVAAATAEMQEPASSSRDSAGTSSIAIVEDVVNAGPSTALDGALSALSTSSEPVHESAASAFPLAVLSEPTTQVESNTMDQASAGVQEVAAETAEVFAAEKHDAIPTVAVSTELAALNQEAHERFDVSREQFDASAHYDISEQDLQESDEIDEVWGTEADVGERPAVSGVIERASASEKIVNQPASHVVSDPDDIAASQPACEDGSADFAAVSSLKVDPRASKDVEFSGHLAAAVAGMSTGDNTATVTAEVTDADMGAGAELEVAERVSLYNKNLERFVQEREALTDECLNLMDLGVEDVELPDEKDNVAMQELMFDLGKTRAQVELLLQFCEDNGLDGKAFLRQNDF